MINRLTESKKGISVIVCCYNSASRLEETLEHLFAQKTAPSLLWEIIVVDNASTDDTVSFAKKTLEKFETVKIHFTITEEKKQGLSFARQHGVEMAKYEYIIFCDDDNRLNNDYLQVAYDLIDGDENRGVIGGEGIPVSDIDLPAWLENAKEEYAIGKPAKTSGIVNSRNYLCGAGMVTRKKLFQNAINNKLPSILSDRKGKSLSSGGDVEYCLRLVLQGYDLYYSADLVFKHFIPAYKLTEEYRGELFRGIDECRNIIAEYIEANSIKKLNNYNKLKLLVNASKDFLKSRFKHRKTQPFTNKLLFYFFNIGCKERSDLKIIKHFYNA